MTKEEKNQKIEQLTSEANYAKDRLSRIEDELREIGAIRKADSLSTLIWKLERWQHTR